MPSNRINCGTVLFVSPGVNIASPYSGQGARFNQLSRGLATDWRVLALVPESIDKSIPWADAQYTYAQSNNSFLTDVNPDFLRSLFRVFSNHHIDIVHLSRGVFGAKSAAIELESNATVVYAAQNVEVDHQSDFEGISVDSRSMGPQTVAAIEQLWVRFADRITTVSHSDRRTFLDYYDIEQSKIREIPTGTTTVDLGELQSTSETRSRLGLSGETVGVFHGWHGHRANQEAVSLLCECIAPEAQEWSIDVEFLLVGKGMPDPDLPNVNSVGFADDLFSILNSADFALVPTLHGGGTKTKVYDYLSLGLPLVATRNGISGIGLEEGTHCLVSDDVNKNFATHIQDLVRSPQLRRSMRKANRKFAAEHTWKKSVDRLDSFYRELL